MLATMRAAGGRHAEVSARAVLVAAAHGTRDAEGTATVEALVAAVRAARPGLDVREAYVDVRPPSPADVLAGLDVPAVLVPVLLSAGYHVGVDLPAAAASTSRPVSVAARLGPDEALADVLADRLDEAGGLGADAVVLAAAGSSDPAAAADVDQLATMLRRRTGRPVVPAYASGSPVPVAEAVASLRARGAREVAVATYLIAPGFFSRKVDSESRELGVRAVSAPLGVHPALVDLVLRRYDAAVPALH